MISIKCIAFKYCSLNPTFYSHFMNFNPQPLPQNIVFYFLLYFSLTVFHNDRLGAPRNPLLDQLPSYQSLLYRRKPSASGSNKRRGSSRTRLGSSSSGKWGQTTLARQHEEKHRTQTLQRPVRELPKPMAEKRRDKSDL